jgi:hypothetical protein
MNLVDITFVAETILPSNADAIQCLLKSEKLEILNLVDLSVSQADLASGNNALIVRAFFEHPAKMASKEIEDYSAKAIKKLEYSLEELLSSENKLFKIKSSVTKFS